MVAAASAAAVLKVGLQGVGSPACLGHALCHCAKCAGAPNPARTYLCCDTAHAVCEWCIMWG
jgi:hypothetical protein